MTNRNELGDFFSVSIQWWYLSKGPGLKTAHTHRSNLAKLVTKVKALFIYAVKNKVEDKVKFLSANFSTDSPIIAATFTNSLGA